MKSIKFGIIITFLIGLLGFFSKCTTKELEKYSDPFILSVDSIQVIDSITANTKFDINFFGPSIANGCYEFSHFGVEKLDNVIMIELWGMVLNSKICPAVMFTITGEILTESINDPGEYLIKITQPDNSYIEHLIIIE